MFTLENHLAKPHFFVASPNRIGQFVTHFFGLVQTQNTPFVAITQTLAGFIASESDFAVTACFDGKDFFQKPHFVAFFKQRSIPVHLQSSRADIRIGHVH